MLKTSAYAALFPATPLVPHSIERRESGPHEVLIDILGADGEFVSNVREDHGVSMLALHLLQNCMVYINTLMLQQLLAQPQWDQRLTTRDQSALTPLI